MVDSRKRLTPGVFSYFSAVERMNVTVTVVQTEGLKPNFIFPSDFKSPAAARHAD